MVYKPKTLFIIKEDLSMKRERMITIRESMILVSETLKSKQKKKEKV